MKRVLLFSLIFLLTFSTIALAETKKVTLKSEESFTVGDQTVKLVKVNSNGSVDLEINGEKTNLRQSKGALKISTSRVILTNTMKNTIDPTFDKAVFSVDGTESVSVSNGNTGLTESLTTATGEANKNINYIQIKAGETVKIGSQVVQLIRVSEGKAKVNLNGEIKEFGQTELFKDTGIEMLFEKVLDNPLDERFDKIIIKVPKGTAVTENFEPIAVRGQTDSSLAPTGLVIKQKMKEEAIKLDKGTTEAPKTEEAKVESPTEAPKPEEKKEETTNAITGNAVADEQTVTLKSVTTKTKGFFVSTWTWIKGFFFSE